MASHRRSHHLGESHSFINERKSEDINTNEMPYYEGDKNYVDEFDEDKFNEDDCNEEKNKCHDESRHHDSCCSGHKCITVCGETGPRGPRGCPGEKGDPGCPGSRGEKGDPGCPGPKGCKGDPGCPGSRGEKGDPGCPGAKGEKGDPGCPGPKGCKGDPGCPGTKGEKGDPGCQGAKGEKGDSGCPGPKGEKGDRGCPGPRGFRGYPGAKGEKGDRGCPGAKGPRGCPGPKGEKGHRGCPGAKGPRGCPGPKGEKGPQGQSGDAVKCACTVQMKNVLRQIIEMFPGINVVINYENNGSATGIPTSILDSGILVLTNSSGVKTHRISICKIVAVTLTCNASFVDCDGVMKIRFLEPPRTLPTGFAAKCEAVVRNTLKSLIQCKEPVTIIAGGNSLGPNKVMGTAYGIAVLGRSTIVSTCSIEDIR